MTVTHIQQFAQQQHLLLVMDPEADKVASVIVQVGLQKGQGGGGG
jgi:hypothetical protein